MTFQVNCGKVLSKQMLFDAYGAGLDAPNKYFGRNWDAFSDCLMGLEWLEARHINIVHDGLPRLTGKDLAVYLEILSIAVAEWNGEKTATNRAQQMALRDMILQRELIEQRRLCFLLRSHHRQIPRSYREIESPKGIQINKSFSTEAIHHRSKNHRLCRAANY